MINFSGKPTINPWLYFTGKTAGYLSWLFYCLSVLHVGFERYYASPLTGTIAILMAASGFLLIILSSVFLGNSTRIGLPEEETMLKTKGIYRYSRNPMYVGFHLVTLSGMVYTLNPCVILPGLFSFIIYHLIIQGEEAFLEERFGKEYMDYKQRVRKYL